MQTWSGYFTSASLLWSCVENNLVLLCLWPAVRVVTWHRHTTMETSGSKHTPRWPSATSERCLASGPMTTWYSCIISNCCPKYFWGKRAVHFWGKRSVWVTVTREVWIMYWHRRGDAVLSILSRGVKCNAEGQNWTGDNSNLSHRVWKKCEGGDNFRQYI